MCHQGLHILIVVLKRLQTTIEFCQQSHPHYTKQELQEFVHNLQDSITKVRSAHIRALDI